MNRILLLLLFALTMSSPGLVAEEGTLPLPPRDPLVKRAPTFSSWTISLAIKQDANAPAGSNAAENGTRTVKEVTIVKTGDTYQESKVWNDGTTGVRWIYQSNVLFMNPNSSQIYILDAEQARTMPSSNNYETSDFPDVDWISTANFMDIAMCDGHLCYRFQGAPPVDNKQNTYPPKSAWIDGKTGLPVAVEDKGVLKRYTFKDAPSQKLELPPNLAIALQKYLKLVDAAKGR